MTVLSHRPKSGGNTGGVTADGRDYTAELWVETDDPEDTGHAVLQYLIAEGFTYGTPYNVGNDDLSSRSPINTALYEISPPELAAGSATVWSVSLKYRQVTPKLMTPTGEFASTPLARRPVISTGSSLRNVPRDTAIYRGGFNHAAIGWTLDARRRVENSAGVPYFPKFETQEQNLIVRVTMNFAAITITQANWPTGWINSEDFELNDRQTRIIVSKYQMKILSWSSSPKFEDGLDYVEVSFEGEVWFRDIGWREEWFDAGFSEIVDKPDITPAEDLKELVQILDGERIPIKDAAPLDGKGVKRASWDKVDRFALWSYYDEIDIRTLPFFQGIIS